MQRPATPPFRRFLAGGLFVALVFNLVAVAVFAWSRDGQTTVVEIETFDGVYRVFVDGRQIPFATDRADGGLDLNAPDSGTLQLAPPVPLSTFPKPSGIDSVVIVDREGNELFRDDFETLNQDVWQVDAGAFEVDRGVLVPVDVESEDGNAISLRESEWGDYSLIVTYRNSRGGFIALQASDHTGVFYHFELIRDFPNFFDVINEDGRQGFFYGGIIRTDAWETTRSIGAMLTEPYPYILAAALVALAATGLLALVEAFLRGRVSWPAKARRLHLDAMPLLTVSVMAIVTSGISLHLASRFYGFVAHYPDEIFYAFQARLIAAGRFTTEVFGPVEAYYISAPTFAVEMGEWASMYPFGHPLLLAIGALAGNVWLIPPLVAGLTVVTTFLLARCFWGAGAGLAAAVLLAASPFLWLQSVTLLSHSTGALYIVLSLLFIVKRERLLLYGALAGLFFGLGVNTRPLNMAFLVLPYGGLMLAYLYETRHAPLAWFKHTGAFLAAVLLMLLAMFGYNWGVTGEPFTTTYAGAAEAGELYGFREGHTVDVGIRNLQALLTTLLLVINGWPSFVGLALVFLPFLLGTRNRWAYFVLVCALVQMLAYAGYRFSGVFMGPRYWYEAMPFLALLGGYGVALAASTLNRCAEWFLNRAGRRPSPVRYAGSLVVGALVVALIAWGAGGWLFGWNQVEDSHNVPYRAEEIEAVFGVDSRLDEFADTLDLENALVLVEPCGLFQSPNCFGTVFLRNDIDFDGDVVWLYYIEGLHEETIAAFPGRDVYIASWDPEPSIRPYMEE